MHAKYVLACDAEKTASDPFAATAAVARRRAEDADEVIITAGTIVPTGSTVGSAHVERLFSRGGLVLTSRRNRLGAAKEELLLLTAYNLTREWKERGQAAGAKEGIVMRRLFSACDGGLDTDPDE